MNCFRLSTRLRAADAKRHEGKGCDQQTSRRCRSGSLLITRHSQRTMTVQGQKQPPETRVSHAFLQLLFGLSAASWTKTWNPDFETQSELQKASFCSLPSVRLGLVCRMSRSFCAEAEHDKKKGSAKAEPRPRRCRWPGPLPCGRNSGAGASLGPSLLPRERIGELGRH